MAGRRTVPSAGGDRDLDPVLDILLEAGLTGSLPVPGNGMAPTLRRDDRIIVAPFLGLPAMGDLVLARTAGGRIVRRLAGVTLRAGRRRYLLRSDAGTAAATEVLREQMEGRVIAIVRQGRRMPVDEGSR